MDIKAKLNEYLALNELEAFFNFLDSELNEQASVRQMVILQQGRLSRLRMQENSGIIDPVEAARTHNRIGYALTQLVHNLSDADLKGNTADHPGSTFSNTLSEGERQGLEQQLQLLIGKSNAIRKQLAIETDPSRTFAYQQQIQTIEAEIAAIKEKLD